MLLLDAASKLQLTASVAGSLDVQVSKIRNASPQTPVPNKLNIAVNTATDICAVPGGTDVDTVESITICNISTTVTTDILVNSVGGSTIRVFQVDGFAPGESIVWTESGVLFVYDATGAVKTGNTAASDTAAGIVQYALQSDMETPTSNALVVTPGRQHFHPGMAKFVAMTTGTTTPALQTPPSYNVTSITDTGVGRLTVTIATDFSSANWCCQVTVVGISTTLTAIALANTGYIRTATLAAGTVEANCRDATATTNALADPSGYMVCGWGDQA